MDRPATTRLRYVAAKKPQDIVDYLDALGVRVQIHGAPVWNGKKWYLWFIPGDGSADLNSIDLEE